MKLILIIIAITIIEALAQYCIKIYNTNSLIHHFVMGVALYGIVAYLLHKTYNYTSMGMSQVLWSGLGVIAIFTVGTIFFDETLTKNELIGAALILLGVGVTQIK